jgi:hypothetical protein
VTAQLWYVPAEMDAAVALEQQPLPHLERPASQPVPQAPMVHVATPFVGTGHAAHEAPHVAGSELETHWPEHRCCPAGQVERHAPDAPSQPSAQVMERDV